MLISQDTRVEKTNDLLNLLRELADPQTDIEQNHDGMAATLMAVYAEEDGAAYRHHYSEISFFLYNNYWTDTDAFGQICDGLDELYQYIDDENVQRAVDKLIDHITLESLRVGQMEEALRQSRDLKEYAQTAKELIDKVEALNQQEKLSVEKHTQFVQEQEQLTKDINAEKTNLEELRNKVDKQNIEAIGVISLFTGVVFAFTGGFTMIGNIFTSVSSITQNRSYFFLACIVSTGIFLYDIIHMLLSFAGKMTSAKVTDKHCFFWGMNIVGFLAVFLLLLFYYRVIPG